MMNSTLKRNDFFLHAFTPVAISVPIILIIISGTLPQGFERGEFLVDGHIGLVLILASALAIRGAYVWGYSRALRFLASQNIQRGTDKISIYTNTYEQHVALLEIHP